jgi:hypothetical protein
MLGKVDGRTVEAHLLHQIRQDLYEHIGGSPTVTQRLLIERAAILSLRLAQLDQRIVADQHFTILDNNQYLAWIGSLSRLLQAIGLKPAQVPQRTLAEHLATLADEAAA